MAKRTTKKKSILKRLPSDTAAPAIRTYEPPIPMASLIGQPHALDILNRSMSSGRVHHAWIFHGPKGVGKFTAAVAWASIILDPSSVPDLNGNIAPDPESQTQRLINAGTHPDLHVIRKEMARYHDDKKIRDAKLASIPKAIVEEHLINPAALASTINSSSMISKVFIVDESELLNFQTQNAILKTLEEPAPGTVIILVSSNEDRLLPTIRSRCQRIAFAPLNDDAMRAWISTSNIETTPEQHQWLLSTSGGSPGKYKSAHAAGIYQWAIDLEPLLNQCDQAQYPLTLGSRMTQLIDDWAKAWVKSGEKIGENRSKLVANQIGSQHMLGLIADRYRKQLATPAKAHRALNAIDKVERAQSELSTNVQLRFAMDHLAAGLSEPQHQLV